MYAEVVMDSFAGDVEGGVFDYIVPSSYENSIGIGMRVIVPFGKKLKEGYIVNIKDSSNVSIEKLKSIKLIPDFNAVFDEKLLRIAKWMSSEYICPLSECIKCIVPPKVSVRERTVAGVELLVSGEEAIAAVNEISSDTRLKKQYELFNVLSEAGKPLALKEIKDTYGFGRSTVDALVKKGIVRPVDIKVERDPYAGRVFKRTEIPDLTCEQRDVLETIFSGARSGIKNFLLHGVTGSGKTEVYMGVIDRMLSMGKQAIMLVPEISLTPQTIERFKRRFQRVAVIHSRLSAGERYDEWVKIKEGRADVVVGARSAVFAPLERLGGIIIDEEHENSYKSDKSPKYVTKEVAYKRCQLENAVLILGSATPSIETYYEAVNGKYKICTMKKRVDGSRMPEIDVVDMREEIISGNRSIFSRRLYTGIKNALSEKDQIILFLNRRGFSTFVSCRKCGLVMKCPRCDVALTYHMDSNMLSCHYCGYTVKSPSICPKCKSNYIKYFGVGTQKIENEVRRYFPGARVLRMDADTTSRKGSHDAIYNAFKKHDADILIGTQMVSKGLDFPGVTLVGVMAADQSLNIPDYKSCERTFDLITQVSGRAGRGSRNGRVIVQTYNPEHYSIIAACHQDYLEFYNEEILVRDDFRYPPFVKLVNILVLSKRENEAKDTINDLTLRLRDIAGKDELVVLGPSPAPVSKINTYFRWQTIIKGEINEGLRQELRRLPQEYSKGSIKVSVDINPVSMI